MNVKIPSYFVTSLRITPTPRCAWLPTSQPHLPLEPPTPCPAHTPHTQPTQPTQWAHSFIFRVRPDSPPRQGERVPQPRPGLATIDIDPVVPAGLVDSARTTSPVNQPGQQGQERHCSSSHTCSPQSIGRVESEHISRKTNSPWNRALSRLSWFTCFCEHGRQFAGLPGSEPCSIPAGYRVQSEGSPNHNAQYHCLAPVRHCNRIARDLTGVDTVALWPTDVIIFSIPPVSLPFFFPLSRRTSWWWQVSPSLSFWAEGARCIMGTAAKHDKVAEGGVGENTAQPVVSLKLRNPPLQHFTRWWRKIFSLSFTEHLSP